VNRTTKQAKQEAKKQAKREPEEAEAKDSLFARKEAEPAAMEAELAANEGCSDAACSRLDDSARASCQLLRR
jgi:hypothetical protein